MGSRHGHRQLTYMKEMGMGNDLYDLIELENGEAITLADAVKDVKLCKRSGSLRIPRWFLADPAVVSGGSRGEMRVFLDILWKTPHILAKNPHPKQGVGFLLISCGKFHTFRPIPPQTRQQLTNPGQCEGSGRKDQPGS